MPDTVKTKDRGRLAEQKAFNYLKTQGLQLIVQNYHCPFGEIDLIMRDNDEMVFIEVRFRSCTDYGDAIETVDKTKQQKLLKSADYYLSKNSWYDKINCRFDVIGFSNNHIEWIKDAFSYE